MYFILWVIIQFYFISSVAQIIRALATRLSSSWLLCSFDRLPSMFRALFGFGFEHFITFWLYQVLQAHLVYFLLQS